MQHVVSQRCLWDLSFELVDCPTPSRPAPNPPHCLDSMSEPENSLLMPVILPQPRDFNILNVTDLDMAPPQGPLHSWGWCRSVSIPRGNRSVRSSFSKRQPQADDAPGNAFRGLGQAVVGVERRVGQLVEPAREAVHVTGADHSANRGRGDPGIREFGKTRNPLHPKEIDRLVALRACIRH